MPQLDFGILFIQLFFNFIFFWFIYFFNLYKVFPILNKTIKYRKYKVKDISKKSLIIEKNIFFLFSLINNSKSINDSLFLNLLNNKREQLYIMNNLLHMYVYKLTFFKNFKKNKIIKLINLNIFMVSGE